MKRIIKLSAGSLAYTLVMPAVLLYRLGRITFGPDNAFPGWSQALSLFPGLVGQYLRRAFYSCTLKQCGNDTCLSFGSIFSHPTASVGNNVYVGSFCCLGAVTIEDDVLIASRVSIMNGCQQHGIDRLDVPIRDQPGRFVAVTVGEGSWIGEGALVAADVGKHCVIGAGAVVTSAIPDYSVAVGVPAKIVRNRLPSSEIHERLNETEGLVTSFKSKS